MFISYIIYGSFTLCSIVLSLCSVHTSYMVHSHYVRQFCLYVQFIHHIRFIHIMFSSFVFMFSSYIIYGSFTLCSIVLSLCSVICHITVHSHYVQQYQFCLFVWKHQWCNGIGARLECGRSWVRSNQKLSIWYLLLLHKAHSIKE